MTPRELRDEVASFGARRKDEYSRDLTLAWHVATFGSAAFIGKLPGLAVVLRRIAPETRASSELYLEAVLIAERIGVPLRPISEAAKQALMRLNKES